ncbi:VCBS repeat-containing protein, partial [bacterium]|nr:VCBS repeat-containing protein [bacterium]
MPQQRLAQLSLLPPSNSPFTEGESLMNRKVFLLFFLMLLTSVGCGRKRTYYDSRTNRNTKIVSDNKPTCSINPSYILVHPQTTPDSITTHQMSLQSNMQVQIIDLRTNPLDFLSTDLASLSFNEKKDNFSFPLSLKNKNGSLTFLVENGEGTPAQCTFGQARGIQEQVDFNGDSLVDTLRLLINDQGLWTSKLFLRTPGGSFTELSLDPQLPLHDPVDQLIVADLNGDTFKDAFIITKTPEPFVLEFRALLSQSDSSGNLSMNPITFTGKWEGEPARGVLNLDVSSPVIKLLSAVNGKVFASDISLAD